MWVTIPGKEYGPPPEEIFYEEFPTRWENFLDDEEKFPPGGANPESNQFSLFLFLSEFLPDVK